MNSSESAIRAGSFSRLPGARKLRGLASIALIFMLSLADALALGRQGGRANAPSSRRDRVLLVVQLADQAQLSQNLPFEVRAQAQAGLLIWPFDRDQARAIFLRAFRDLLPSTSDRGPADALDTERQELRVELLSEIAYRDLELAEGLARSLPLAGELQANEGVGVVSSDGAPRFIAGHGSIGAESRDLLVDLALRVAESDSAHAMQLGQLSIEAGVSPHLDRLLSLIAETDKSLADRLFSSAVDYLERTGHVSSGDLHTLGFYLISSAGPADEGPRAQAVIVRFLNLALDSLTPNFAVNQAAARSNAADQSFDIYCIGKYLADLLPRYLPDRVPELQSRLSYLSYADGQELSGETAGNNATQYPLPSLATDGAIPHTVDGRERDLLYARAALGWLTRGDVCQAQHAALNISDAEIRDRTLLQVARELTWKARFRDALQIAPLIADRAAEAQLIVRLAQAASSLRHTACAKTLLELAELEASKIEGPYARARALLAIAGGLSLFEPERAFAVMQEAVIAINEVPVRGYRLLDPGQSVSPASAQGEAAFHPDFANSLTALAQTDFDRALLLSRQLRDEEISLTAQLAVCRGGLETIDLQMSHSN